jgi:hypothetical protein
MGNLLGGAEPARQPKSYSEYNKSPAGKARRRKYRHDRSKYVTDAKYLSREIVAVDGEGFNLSDGSHDYVMLGISHEKSLIDLGGLQTAKTLRYLFSHLSSENLNVIYGGSYDFNMWLKGIDRETLAEIYNANFLSKGVDVHGFTVKWQKGKGFSIEKDGRLVVINDVVSFFQCPFVQACDDYLQDSPLWQANRDLVIREKAKRGDFDVSQLAEIDEYNQLELQLLVELVTELRVRLNKVNLRPRRWNGPGAIASALFTREKVKQHLATVPTPVATAGRFAYFGGRFEMLKYGAVQQKVYEYDINSAYPAALSRVPSLRDGLWSHSDGDIHDDDAFALYHVRYAGTRSDIPGPVGVRGSTGNVSYPLKADAWIWTPELLTLKKYCDVVEGAIFEVVEVWHFKPADMTRPFAFVPALFEQRRILKAAGDGAQIALKLALNSMYGKLAQQVGWIPGTPSAPMRIPPYHQLEWAGYVTSWTRAKVLEAALENLEAIIAFETDALFSTEPLNVTIGTGLGEWELTEFDSLTYVQSGHYYGTLTKGKKVNGKIQKEVVKCRGIDKGQVTRRQVEDLLALPESQRILPAQLTRFYGAGVALMRNLENWWCRWKTEPKKLSLYPTGKRIHIGCDACNSEGLTLNVWHTTVCPVTGGVSHEYPVEWINPNPMMTEISDVRRSEVDYDID